MDVNRYWSTLMDEYPTLGVSPSASDVKRERDREDREAREARKKKMWRERHLKRKTCPKERNCRERVLKRKGVSHCLYPKQKYWLDPRK